MIDHSAIRAQAVRTYEAQHLVIERAIAILKQPRLLASRAHPPTARRRTGASGDDMPPEVATLPSGSAVEAGRPANFSDEG